MVVHDNPYIAWVNDLAGGLTPSEEVVAGQLPALAAALQAEQAPACAVLREECERRWPGEAVPDDEVLAPHVTELLLTGAAGVLDPAAGDPMRAAFLEAALRYAHAPGAAHTLERPATAPPARDVALAAFDAWLAGATGRATEDVAGVAEVVARRGVAVVRERLYGEPRHTGMVRLEPARLGARAAAYVLDWFCLSAFRDTLVMVLSATGLVATAHGLGTVGYAGLALGLLAGGFCLLRWGGTPGRLAMGLEVRRRGDHERLKPGAALARQWLGEWLNLFFCGAGFWLGIFRGSHHTWADDVSGAEVVTVPVAPGRRRGLRIALAFVSVFALALNVWSASIGVEQRRLPADLDAAFVLSKALRDSIDRLATRPAKDREAFDSDLRGVLAASVTYDSLLRVESRTVRHYRGIWFLAPALRQHYARVDSLLVMRRERSDLRKRLAFLGLSPDTLPDSPARRHARYIDSDILALDRRMQPLNDALTTERLP